MSPTEALASEVFRIYLILIAAILVVSGAVLAALRWGLRRDVGHAWKAYRGWLVIVPLLVGTIFLGRAATILFVTLVSIFGFKEYARATGLYRDWVMTALVYLGIVAVGVVSFVPDPQLGPPRVVWPVCDSAGVCHRRHPARADCTEPFARATANDRPGAVGLPLHRLDARPY